MKWPHTESIRARETQGLEFQSQSKTQAEQLNVQVGGGVVEEAQDRLAETDVGQPVAHNAGTDSDL